MFLHIGNSKNIREKEIIGIFDADTATVSGITRKYLSACEKRGSLDMAGEEIPKSFVLYRKDRETKVCFSQLSTSALIGRSEKTLKNEDIRHYE